MSIIQPTYSTIQKLLANRRFNIDEYQREYKWEQKHLEELITDLTTRFNDSYKTGDETSDVKNYNDYFLGPIIIASRNGESYIVDGQQRCTTLTLILIYMYHKCKGQNDGPQALLEQMIFSNNLGEKNFNINVPERTSILKDLFEGNEISIDDKDESVRNIVLRYQDIEEINLEDELQESFQHFIYWFLTKVGVIEITTTNPEQAYEIFETMNSRGKPLSPVDMLKSYLIGEISDQDKLREANRLWKQTVKDLIYWGDSEDEERDDDCIKAWLRSKYAQTIRERKINSVDKDWELIGSSFHKWTRDNSDNIVLGNQDNNYGFMTNDFAFYANSYKLILEASQKFTPGLEAVFYNARLDFTLQRTVLLAALNPTDDRTLVITKINTVATYLNIWIMRRVVNFIRTGYSASSYAMFNLCKEIRSKSLEELVNILVKKLEADDTTFQSAKDGRRGGISEFTLNNFTPKTMYQFLARITAFVDYQSGRPDPFEQLVDRKGKILYDIEHIWANKFETHKDEFTDEASFQSWRNLVAALVLLPSDVNRSFQDKNYESKVPHYAKQNIWAASLTEPTYEHQPQFQSFIKKYNLDFKPYSQFTSDSIDERASLLSALSEIIWNPETIREVAKLDKNLNATATS